MQRVYGADAAVGVARLNNLVVYLEREIPDAEPHLEWLGAALDDAIDAFGKRTAHLHLVEVANRRRGMRDGPRERFAELARSYDGRLGAAAFVVDQTGFGASVVRSVITGVLLVVGPRSPTRSFRALEDAHAWLTDQCGALPSVASVERCVARLRTP